MNHAILIYDQSDRNSDIYYASGFNAPDPFLFIQHNGQRIVALTDLELERGKKEAKADKVISLDHYVRKSAPADGRAPELLDAFHLILSELKIKHIQVSPQAGIAMVEGLRERGYTVSWEAKALFPQRYIKTEKEKKEIIKAEKAVIKAIKLAEKILKESDIHKKSLYYNGKPLRSDSLRTAINICLLEQGYVTSDTIVAGGDEACDPHNPGSQLLRPHEAIIIDIYPRTIKSGYYGDFTRTYCRGQASFKLKKQYKAVKNAQELAISMIREGVIGRDVHQAVNDYFESQGYHTGVKEGVIQGFFHGTGHGIGLDLHEFPRISTAPIQLKAGMIISVEPGLYYKGVGGIRIEDLVYVTKNGCEVLSKHPKKFEIL